MKRILFAWEAGENFGHVTQIVDVAKVLAERGWEVFFALKNPAAANIFAGKLDYHLLQAPYKPMAPLPSGQKRVKPLIYPDILLPCGYNDPDELAALIQCWRKLFDLVKPDVLVTQAAPTALLASTDRKFSRISLGKGYDIPPIETPMPSMRYWEKADTKALKDRESHVLENINQARKMAGMPKLKRFSDLLKVDRQFLCIIKELDHYPQRAGKSKDSDYSGPFFKIDSGEKYNWQKGAKQRIFAYIRPNSASFEPCLNALHSLPDDHDIIVAAPSISEQIKQKMEKPNMRIIPQAVRLDSLLADCDLAINHASAGICSALALHGVPMLMFPNHLEQHMFARAVGRNKIGEALAGRFDAKQIRHHIDRMLANPDFKQRALEVADKYKGSSPEKLAVTIADEIEKSTTRKKKK